jgi:hypothetical protein
VNGEERGGDENEYVEKRLLPRFNYHILKLRHIDLLYKYFYILIAPWEKRKITFQAFKNDIPSETLFPGETIEHVQDLNQDKSLRL